MGRPKKDKFADLDEDFRDSIAGMDEAGIKRRIAEIALNQVAMNIAKENDEDLQQKQEAAKVAGEGYREVTKMNRLRIEYARQVLGDKGKDNGSYGEE